jgi:hypothetical protein
VPQDGGFGPPLPRRSVYRVTCVLRPVDGAWYVALLDGNQRGRQITGHNRGRGKLDLGTRHDVALDPAFNPHVIGGQGALPIGPAREYHGPLDIAVAAHLTLNEVAARTAQFTLEVGADANLARKRIQFICAAATRFALPYTKELREFHGVVRRLVTFRQV